MVPGAVPSEEAAPFRRGRRLAVDVGDARIGVASSDPDGVLATPVETVPGRDVPAPGAALASLVAEYEPLEVVVGLPRSLHGGEGPAAAKVRDFAQELAKKTSHRFRSGSSTNGCRRSRPRRGCGPPVSVPKRDVHVSTRPPPW